MRYLCWAKKKTVPLASTVFSLFFFCYGDMVPFSLFQKRLSGEKPTPSCLGHPFLHGNPGIVVLLCHILSLQWHLNSFPKKHIGVSAKNTFKKIKKTQRDTKRFFGENQKKGRPRIGTRKSGKVCGRALTHSYSSGRPGSSL